MGIVHEVTIALRADGVLKKMRMGKRRRTYPNGMRIAAFYTVGYAPEMIAFAYAKG